MQSYTIELPDVLSFRRAGFDMEVRLEGFTAEIIAQAVQHGLVQTIGDAASAAASGAWEGKRDRDADPDWKQLTNERKKEFVLNNPQLIADEGRALMDKRIAALREGDWTTRAPAQAGLSKFDAYCAEVVKGHMVFDKGVKTADRMAQAFAAFEGLAPAKREAVQKLAKARIEREREEATLGLDLSL